MISAAALASAVVVISLMWIAGAFASIVFVFSMLFTLIFWRKIGSFRRARKDRELAANRPAMSVSPPLTSKRIQTIPAAEKISA